MSGRRRRVRPRASELLERLLGDHPYEPATIGGRIAGMEDRAFGALLLLFALPNVLPLPPGASMVMGVPLILIAAQMILGLPRPYLPAWVARWSPRHRFFDGVAAASRAVLGRIERLVRPRWPFLSGHPSRRALGAVCLVLAVMLSLPIPFGNLLPSLALSLIALGLLERDGLCIAAGLAVGAVALLFVASLVIAVDALPDLLRRVRA